MQDEWARTTDCRREEKRREEKRREEKRRAPALLKTPACSPTASK